MTDGTIMTIRVRGASMRPTLSDGDEVRVKVFARAPRVGDVVLVRLDGEHVLHRVIAVGRASIRTQGDARSGPDAEVPLEAVLGTAELPRRALRARLAAATERVRALARRFARVRGRSGPAGAAEADRAPETPRR